MLTKAQIEAFYATPEGKAVEKQMITTYIQTNDEGKELFSSIMAPELASAKIEAAKEWEATKGKGIKDKNIQLLEELANLKKDDSAKKIQELLDMSPFSSYNDLEEAVLTFKANQGSGDEELIALKKELSSYRIKANELDKQLPALQEQLTTSQNANKVSEEYISKLLIHSEIKGTLVNEGFDDLQATGLVDRIAQMGKFSIDIDPDTHSRKAVNEYGLSPTDYTLKEYLITPEGKSFKPNFANGGGAQGGGKPPRGKLKSIKEMSWTERALMRKTDPEGYEKLKLASQ